MYESREPFPALKPSEVYFFISKDAFPPDLLWVPVGSLDTPENGEWSYVKLVAGFQKRAAEIGGNAVVFENVRTWLMTLGFLYYTSHADVYRLFKKSPLEDVDLSSSQYGTQTPNLQLVPNSH